MDIFGREVSRKNVLEATAATAAVAAVATALSLFGNKDISLGVSVSSTELCNTDNPTLVKNETVVSRGFGRAEAELVSDVSLGTGTAKEQVIARNLLHLLAKRDSNGNWIFSESNNDRTCTVDGKPKDKTGLTDHTEELIGQFEAAGIEVNLNG